MLNWADPKALKNYSEAPRGQGLYVIGEPIDRAAPVTACTDYDAYLGTWPDNLRPLYVGISQSKGSGVRGRLSCHARRKGNKRIGEQVARGDELFFITVSSEPVTEYESLLLLLKTTGQFEGNVRSETERSARRQMKRIRKEMGPDKCAFYDALDMGEHGEGM